MAISSVGSSAVSGRAYRWFTATTGRGSGRPSVRAVNAASRSETRAPEGSSTSSWGPSASAHEAKSSTRWVSKLMKEEYNGGDAR